MNFKDGGTQSYHCALKYKDHEEALLFRDSHRAVAGKEQTSCDTHGHEESKHRSQEEEFHVIHQQNRSNPKVKAAILSYNCVSVHKKTRYVFKGYIFKKPKQLIWMEHNRLKKVTNRAQLSFQKTCVFEEVVFVIFY
jgi:hypothetical protein